MPYPFFPLRTALTPQAGARPQDVKRTRRRMGGRARQCSPYDDPVPFLYPDDLYEPSKEDGRAMVRASEKICAAVRAVLART